MISKFIFLIFLIFSSCTNLKQSSVIDNEHKFNYKAQVNLYLINEKKKLIKSFYKFSYHEYLARNKVNQLCLGYVKINKLKNIRCVYMGTKQTEKILTALD